MCKDQSDYHVIAGLFIGFFFLLEFSIISKFSTMILLHLHKENNKITRRKELWNQALMLTALIQAGWCFYSVFPQMGQWSGAHGAAEFCWHCGFQHPERLEKLLLGWSPGFSVAGLWIKMCQSRSQLSLLDSLSLVIFLNIVLLRLAKAIHAE